MSEWESGTEIYDETVEIITYLQTVYDLLEAGRELDLTGDPFYDRSPLPALSDQDVDRVIAAIDAEFAYEIEHSVEYHIRRSGSKRTPDFCRLGPSARRTVVETVDEITRRWRDKPGGTPRDRSQPPAPVSYEPESWWYE